MLLRCSEFDPATRGDDVARKVQAAAFVGTNGPPRCPVPKSGLTRKQLAQSRTLDPAVDFLRAFGTYLQES